MTWVTDYMQRLFNCYRRSCTHPNTNPAVHIRESNSQPVDQKSDVQVQVITLLIVADFGDNLSPKTATVAVFKRRLSPFSATIVSIVDRALVSR